MYMVYNVNVLRLHCIIIIAGVAFITHNVYYSGPRKD